LGFRNYFCGRGLCAGCRLTVDGTVKKACHTLLEPGREYIVEPLKDYPVIRDLVVDFGLTRLDPKDGRAYHIREGVNLTSFHQETEGFPSPSDGGGLGWG